MDESAAVQRAGAYLRGDDARAQVQFAARRIGADQVADRLAHEGGLPWTARWLLPVEESTHRTVIALRGPITALWTGDGTVGAIAASGQYAVCDDTGRVLVAGLGRATAGLTVDGRHFLVAADGARLWLWEAADTTPVERDHADVRLRELRAAGGPLLVGVEPTYYDDYHDIETGGATRTWTVRCDPPRLHEGTPGPHPTSSTASHPSGFTGGRDGVVRVWDVEPGPPPVPLATPVAVACATLSDGRRVAVVAHDNDRVGIWDLDEGAPPDPVPQEFRGPVTVACVRPPHGPHLAAVGCLDGTLHIFDLDTQRSIRTIVMPTVGPLPGTGTYRPPGVPATPPGPEPIRGVAAAVRADGSPVVVTVGDLGGLRWWCPATGRELATVRLEHSGRGVACRDGQVVVATTGFSPQVYDLTTATRRETLPATGRFAPAAVDLLDGLVAMLDGVGALHRIALDGSAPDAAGSSAPDGVKVTGHYGRAETVACGHHPDGRAVVVTGGWDGTVRVWDLRTGTELHRIPIEHPVRSVALAPDGTIVVGWQGGMGVFRLHATGGRP